jgi:mannose-6-phosphate isomerase class I
LSEHTAPFDALVHVVDGEAEITISGKKYTLAHGEMIVMPANQPHALKALELDETIAEAHFACAMVLQWYEWDWCGADKNFCGRANSIPSNSAQSSTAQGLRSSSRARRVAGLGQQLRKH